MLKNLLFGLRVARLNSLARPWRLLVLLELVLGHAGGAWAQLTGTKTIGTDYATVAAAITVLNAQGVGAGGVTFNVPAGYTETFTSPTAGSITLNSNSPNPGTAANPIIFQKTGAGNNPLITGGVGTTTALDAIISLVGTDYVTFTNIDVADASGNASATTQAEFGYALFRASATDGCQNVNISGAIITLNKTNVNTIGIRGANTTATSTTAVVATSAAGANSNIKLNGNTIASAFIGIYLQGGTATASLTDMGNEIGSSAGNTMSSLGGSNSSVYGIRGEFQQNLKVENNTIAIPLGNTSTTVYGIGLGTGTATGIVGTVLLNNNTIAIASATTSTVIGILQGGSSAVTTSTITNNKVQNSVLTGATGAFYAIQDAATTAATAITLTGNQVTNNTAATTGTVYLIYKTGTAATVTISSNTITGNTKSGTGTLYGIYSISTITNLTANTNIVNTNTVSGSGASTLYGIIFNPTGTNTNQTVNGNTVSGNQILGSSGLLAGLFLGSSGTIGTSIANTNTITNNTIPNTSGTTASINYGIYSFPFVNTTETMTGNTVTGLSLGGANTATANILTGIFSNTSTIPKTISQNTVGNLVLTMTGTGATGTTTGILNVSGSTVALTQNKVYGLSASGAGGIVAGLSITGGTSTTAANNLIGALTAPTATSATAVAGLQVSGGTTVNLYYNTIYLAAAGAATFGSSGIYLSSTSPTVTLINNIVNNKSTPGATSGLTVALRRTAAAVTSYASASNNNLYYAGTPSSNTLLYYDGTNSYQTLAAFQTGAGITPRESASKTEDVLFVSTTGSDGTFLHINPGTATQVESGGTTISGITTDYDGDIRNATTPDIGADEGSFTPNDQTPPTITYTALANTASTTSRTLVATITDASGINTTNLPRIYYRLSTGSYYSAVATSSTGSSYTFTIDYANTGGTPVAGNIIQYYVVAQDASSNANVGTSPSGGSGTSPTIGVTPPTTPASYQILATLAGNYYVGTSTHTPAATYATITAAATAYNSSGLGGAVNFILIDPTYTTAETFPITFNANGDASVVNQLTISPEVGVNATVSGSNTTALLVLNGADYVTLDGSNNSTTSRNLTLANAGAAGTTVLLSGAGAGGGATNDVLRNLNITASASTSGVGISVGGSTGGSTGADNDNVTIQNNSIQQAFLGIYVGGTAAVSAGGADGLSIAGNMVGPATGGSGNIGGTGLFIANAVAPSITGNTVQNVSLATAGSLTVGMNFSAGVPNATVTGNLISGILVSAGSYDALGMNLGTGFTGGVVDRNRVLNIVSNTSTYGGRGIDISTGSATSNLRVSNNFVAGINGSGWSSFASDAIVGIRVLGNTGGVNLYYNSVNLSGGYASASASNAYQSAALFVASTVTGLDVRNNVLANTLVNSTSSSKAYAFYSAAAKTAFTTINYNDYFVGTGSQAFLGNLSGTGASLGTTGDLTTLAAFQAATGTGQDVNSLNSDPTFSSATDLHTSAAALNAVATPIMGLTTDIDGDPRDATTPDIGADEFTPATLDIQPTALLAPAASQICFGNAEPVTVTIRNNATTSLDFSVINATVTVSVTGAAIQAFTATLSSGTLAAGATQNVTVGNLNMTALGTYSFAVTATVAGDANTTNDALTPAPTRTNAAPQSALPYAEPFNSSATPTNFTLSGFSTSTSANNGGATGSYGLRYNIYSGNVSASATTPTLGTTVSNSNVLTFDGRFTNFSGTTPATVLQAGDKLEVQVATCGGAFATVYTINNANQNGTGAASTSFYTYSVPLTGVGSGQKIQVRLVATYGGTTSSDFYVDLDNLSVQSLVNTDLAPTALVAPTATQGCYGAAEAVTVTVKNLGAAIIDFTANPATVTVGVTGGTTATLTGTITSGTLAAGITQNVTLTAGGSNTNGTLDMTATGTYTFALTATVTGDGNTANDVLAPSPTRTVAAPAAGTLSPATATLCNSGTATLTLTGSANGSIQYQQSSSATGPFISVATGGTTASYTTPVLTATTYYRAQTTCGTNVATSNVATVTVNTPLISSTNSPQTICSGSTATLTANGSSGTTVRFFAAATGGTALATGTTGAATASYTTPALTATTTYYAEAFVSGTTSVGPLTNTGSGSQSSASQYLIFNVSQPVTLAGVNVYPGAAGNVVIEYRNSTGTVLQSATVAVTAAQINTKTFIPLNFNLVAGTAQRLGIGTGSGTMFRNDAGVSYPYTGGSISITGNSFDPTYYYYFYDWLVSSDCASTRTAVQATVNPRPTATFNGTSPATVCAGTGTTLTGTLTGTAPFTGQYTVNGGAAQTLTTSGSTFSIATGNLTVNTTFAITVLSDANCTATGLPVSFTVNTTSTTTYTGAAPGDGNNWFNAANWSACVPSATVDATIPAGLTNYPALTTTATAEVRALTIASGGSLSQSAGTLNVYGNLSNSGNTSLTGGTVALRGTSPTVTGLSTFYALEVNLANGTVQLSNATSISNQLKMTQGVLNTNSYTLTLLTGSTLMEDDNSYLLGTVSVPDRTLTAGTAESFSGIGLVLTPAVGSTSPGSTPVVRTTGTALTGVGTSVSIKRFFDIQPATNTGLNVAMDFTYLNHELNAIPSSTLVLFKSVTTTAGPWANQSPITIAGNTISKTGIADFSIWTLGNSANPLPVQLTRFVATRVDNDAALAWTTASEKNSRGFEVQVSTDGRSYRTLALVASPMAASTTVREYAYRDREAGKADLRYYRLRQLDLDGTATFSPVRTLRFEGEATAVLGLRAAPNPFHERLALTLTLPAYLAGTSAQLRLTDAAGRTLSVQHLEALPAGISEVLLPEAATLSSGVYFVELDLPGQPAQHLKVVKE